MCDVNHEHYSYMCVTNLHMCDVLIYMCATNLLVRDVTHLHVYD